MADADFKTLAQTVVLALANALTKNGANPTGYAIYPVATVHDAGVAEQTVETVLRIALPPFLAKPEAQPAGAYSCGCPARWAERRVNGFCGTHYRPLKDEEPANG